MLEGKADSSRFCFTLPHPFKKTNVHSLATVDLASPRLLDLGSPPVMVQIRIWTTAGVGTEPVPPHDPDV